jgi:hypothetical protein
VRSDAQLSAAIEAAIDVRIEGLAKKLEKLWLLLFHDETEDW